MNVISLKCQDSISSCIDYCHVGKQSKYLMLGHNYQIYLIFDLPPCLCLNNLIQARLILFKVLPFSFTAKKTYTVDKYNIYPLLDFYSAYNCMFSPPCVDCGRGVIFEDDYCCNHTEVDITNIVMDWLGSKIENYGLLLTGNEHSRYISYAAERYEVIGMRPMIRLTCKETEIYRPLSAVPCKVNVH